MTYVRKKPRERSGIDRGPKLRFPGHLAFVRKHRCIVPGCERRDTQACHVRSLPGYVPEWERGGLGKKPHDKWTYSGCFTHHDEQHHIGEGPFERKYGVNLVAAAEEFQRASPHRFKWMEDDEP